MMTMHDLYETPEGYKLARPLTMPDARSFAEVLTYHSEWDHVFMTMRRDDVARPDLVPAPRYAPTEPVPSWRDGRDLVRNEIGPYCTIDARQIDGPAHRSIAVTITDAALESVRDRIVTDDDHLGFKVIIHGERDGRPARALIILEHGHIIGSHYLAYVDPATLPAYPFAARDASAERVAFEIKGAGHEVYQCRHVEPHEIVYRPFVRVKPRRFGEPYGYDWQGGPITIKADGKIVRSAADIASRLEHLRGELRAERISYGEIAELQGLAEHIEPGDTELLEWAGVPEFPDDEATS